MGVKGLSNRRWVRNKRTVGDPKLFDCINYDNYLNVLAFLIFILFNFKPEMFLDPDWSGDAE